MKKIIRYILFVFITFVFSCATGLQFDEVTRPTVVSTSPGTAEINVSVSNPVIVQFSENIDSSTITSSSFVVQVEETEEAVEGTYSVDGKTVTFQPDENLEYSEVYTVSLSTSIRSVTGIAMENSYDWEFTTSTGKTTNWIKSYGWAFNEIIEYGFETSDGGALAVGYVQIGKAFGLAIKLDSGGEVEWSKMFGVDEESYDYTSFSSAVETADGYVLVGRTASYGAGSSDGFIVKLDLNGDHEWQQAYGGTEYDEFSSVIEDGEGNYIVGGYTSSYGAGENDAWLVKVDSDGAIVTGWQFVYGGLLRDYFKFLRRTSDGGLIALGKSESAGAGDYDVLVVKLNSDGDVTWSNVYGSAGEEEGMSITAITGGYVFVATSDALGFTNGGTWIVRTNSSGVVQDQNALGSDSFLFWAANVLRTGSGYLVSGVSQVSSSVHYGVVANLTSSFGIDWQSAYGSKTRGSKGFMRGLSESESGGYLAFGLSNQVGYGEYDAWIMSLESDGNCGDDCSVISSSNLSSKSVSGSTNAIVLSKATTTATVTGTDFNPFTPIYGIKTQCSKP